MNECSAVTGPGFGKVYALLHSGLAFFNLKNIYNIPGNEVWTYKLKTYGINGLWEWAVLIINCMWLVKIAEKTESSILFLHKT